jgi:membrane protein required for colicin V production
LDKLPLNIVDIGVLAVIALSALLAFSRGLVREVLSIGAWVVAALATVYGLPYLTPVAQKFISAPLVAQIVTGTTIFVVTLFICAAISHLVARNVRHSGFGAVDRSLGLIFGVARGAILVCLAYLAFVWAEPKPEDQPDVVKNARTLKYVAQGAELIKALLPRDAFDKGAAAAADAKTQVEQAVTGQIIPSITPSGAPSNTPSGTPDQTKPAAAPAGNSGYNKDDRKGMDQLINNSQ